MQLAASALLLLPGAPPLEDAVGFGRDEVAGEAGHRDRRAGGVQGEVDLARRCVALEHRLQVGLELALGFGVRFVGLHRARVGLQVGSARASGASSARWEGVGVRVGLRAPFGTSARWRAVWAGAWMVEVWGM